MCDDTSNGTITLYLLVCTFSLLRLFLLAGCDLILNQTSQQRHFDKAATSRLSPNDVIATLCICWFVHFHLLRLVSIGTTAIYF